MFRARHVLAFGLLVGSLAASLLVAEILVRAVVLQQLVLLRPDIWQPADTLGWTHRPNVDTSVNTGERTVRFVTDSMGFRVGPGGPVQADTRILLLGDSYMAALQVEYDKSLAGLMEEELPALLGEQVTVRNSGVSSWDPPHYLIQARRILAEKSFDLVVVAVYLGNDVVDWRTDAFTPRRPMERWQFRMPRELSRAAWIESLVRPVDDLLKRRSHLFILAKTAFETGLMRLGLSARYVPEELQMSHAESSAWENTADMLQEIDALAAQQQIPVLFALIPSVYQVESDLLERHAQVVGVSLAELDVDQPSRVLGDALEARGLLVIDLLRAFREKAQAGSPPLFGRIDPHFSPEGHRAMWEVIRPTVMEHLMIDEPIRGESFQTD